MIDQPRSAGVNFEHSKELEDPTFVLTGSMESMTNDEAGDKIKAHGGNISGRVSENTNLADKNVGKMGCDF